MRFVSDPTGNYSAADHGLGGKILALNRNALVRVVDLATSFTAVKIGHEVRDLVRSASLKHLSIGVGSEMSCMINPEKCWVANVRTIWTHLVISHDGDFDKAALQLKLYSESDRDSEMSYGIWFEIHAELKPTMTLVAEQGAKLAKAARVQPGKYPFLWADAISNQLYSDYYET